MRRHAPEPPESLDHLVAALEHELQALIETAEHAIAELDEVEALRASIPIEPPPADVAHDARRSAMRTRTQAIELGRHTAELRSRSADLGRTVAARISRSRSLLRHTEAPGQGRNAGDQRPPPADPQAPARRSTAELRRGADAAGVERATRCYGPPSIRMPAGARRIAGPTILPPCQSTS
jgi:hypothetical protein